MAEKPEKLELEIKNLPLELVKKDQWVTWRWQKREGRWTKPPYDPKTNRPAKSNDPTTWGTFDAAIDVYLANKSDGIGFMITKDDPFCGFDWDHCRNPETGELRDWARAHMTRFNSYSEVTPSRGGCRTWIRGKLPGDGHHNDRFGVFDSGRYFCMTGVLVDGLPPKIEDRQVELDVFIKENWPEDTAPVSPKETPRTTKATLEDKAIVDKMLGAKNGMKVLTLMNGKWEGD